MEFNGLHIACGFLGGATKQAWATDLLNQVVWSQTFDEAGTTSLCAPEQRHPDGEAVFEVATKVDAWIALGRSPDATIGPRIFLWAGSTRTIFAKAGDFIAWQPA